MGTAKKVQKVDTRKAVDEMIANEEKKKAIPKEEDPILKEEPLVLLTGEKKYFCSKCKADISEKVAKYSYDKFGKYLCYKCQR